MTDSAMAAILARTYLHTVTAFRPLPDGGEEAVCQAAPCALSRSAHTSAPTPPDGFYVLPEAAYRLSLYTRPELGFRLAEALEAHPGLVLHPLLDAAEVGLGAALKELVQGEPQGGGELRQQGDVRQGFSGIT